MQHFVMTNIVVKNDAVKNDGLMGKYFFAGRFLESSLC